MKVDIRSIPVSEHRYETSGDYWWEGDVLVVRVSEQQDWRHEFLVAIHELIEEALTRHRGIKEEDILAFDTSEAGVASDDPGAMVEAPYHKEHIFAGNIERLVAHELGVDWEPYDEGLRDGWKQA